MFFKHSVVLVATTAISIISLQQHPERFGSIIPAYPGCPENWLLNAS